MNRGVPAGLILAALIGLGPGVCVAQDLCTGRADCSQMRPQDAGADDAGRRLQIYRVTVPSPIGADGSPDCSGPIEEFWLRRGSARPALIGHACANVGISEGFDVAVGENRLNVAFAGPGGAIHSDYSTTYWLSPVRVHQVQVCTSSSGLMNRFIRTRIVAGTLTGEALARVGPPASGESSDDIGCTPGDANQAWLPIARMALDDEALRMAGAGLGSCASSMGPGASGYLLVGRRPAGVEVRMLATGPRRLILQTSGIDAGAGPLSSRTHLEVWASDAPFNPDDPGREGEVSMVRVDPVTGAIETGSGAGLLPRARHWQARLPNGRRADLVALTWPEGEIRNLEINLTVRLRLVSAGASVATLSTSRRPGHAASDLGQTFDVAPFTRCAVRRGMLDITQAGFTPTPFEANEAGGLRILR